MHAAFICFTCFLPASARPQRKHIVHDGGGGVGLLSPETRIPAAIQDSGRISTFIGRRNARVPFLSPINWFGWLLLMFPVVSGRTNAPGSFLVSLPTLLKPAAAEITEILLKCRGGIGGTFRIAFVKHKSNDRDIYCSIQRNAAVPHSVKITI